MRQHSSQYQPRPLFTAPIHTLIILDRSSGMPLYRQICQRLREGILSGELSEGTRLPTERALASELGVNRTTVMNAYNELASEGLIEGHVGRGTLVRRNQFGYIGDSFENETASWLLGLPAGERGSDSIRAYIQLGPARTRYDADVFTLCQPSSVTALHQDQAIGVS